MMCEHLKELKEFVEKNELEVGGLDMIRLVCKKCNVQYECPNIASDYWLIKEIKDPPQNS